MHTACEILSVLFHACTPRKRTYQNSAYELGRPKVTLRHLVYIATNSVGVDKIHMAIGVDLLDDVKIFNLPCAIDFVLRDCVGHGGSVNAVCYISSEGAGKEEVEQHHGLVLPIDETCEWKIL